MVLLYSVVVLHFCKKSFACVLSELNSRYVSVKSVCVSQSVCICVGCMCMVCIPNCPMVVLLTLNVGVDQGFDEVMVNDTAMTARH